MPALSRIASVRTGRKLQEAVRLFVYGMTKGQRYGRRRLKPLGERIGHPARPTGIGSETMMVLAASGFRNTPQGDQTLKDYQVMAQSLAVISIVSWSRLRSLNKEQRLGYSLLRSFDELL